MNGTRDCQRLRLLLVEPDAELARRLATSLERSGQEVVRVEASENLPGEGDGFDAAIVGPSAPHREGVATLRRRLGGLAPVVLGEQEVARALGCEDWLPEEEWTPRALARICLQSVERHAFARELHHLIEERLAGEASMRNVVASWADGVLVASSERRILYANPAAEALLDVRADRLVGSKLPFNVEAGRPALEMELVGVSGARTVTVGAVALEWEGRPALLLTLRDETERLEAERALQRSERQLMQAQKMEAIGRLAGGVAHDFNNLLTAISGYSELLAGEISEAARPDLVEIQKATDRASRLTRQLLAFSRRQVLSPVVLDVNEIVNELQKLLRRVLGEDVELSMSLAREPVTVEVDPGQLEQVLLDLSVNAREAMPGGGTLRVETAVRAIGEAEDHGEFIVPAGTYARLVVSDTGGGMDAETLRRVFEPFFTTKPEGTGLGLSTVYGTVKQSGGYVFAESSPGAGSRFEILLPRTEEPPDVAAPRPSPGRETILVAEDERPVRELARRILEREGYRVLVASTGAEALRVASGHPDGIDLMLADVVMPELGGVEAAEALRGERPGVKLLFLSGYSDRVVARNGFLDSGDAYLSKPFTGAELVAKVRSVLDACTVPS